MVAQTHNSCFTAQYMTTTQVDSFPLMEVQNLTKSFGGLLAVDHVSIQFQEKKVFSIIGPNGAGKTTLFNLITGQFTPSSGEIFFKGERMTNLSPDEIFRRGVGRTFQTPSIFPELEVLKNIEIAAQGKFRTSNSPLARLTLKRTQIRERAGHLLQDLKLNEVQNTPAKLLTYGDKRRLEIAMGLICEPELLLLDEPTAGMGLEEAEQTASLLKKISSDITIILIEHDMNVVMNISDRAIILNRGRILVDGPPGEILANKEVRKLYMGEI